MILGTDDRAPGAPTTLDDLFRRAGVRHPDALALADPPNRASFAEGAPHALTFAQADRAISALAAKLRRLGLYNDTVVAIQLANTVESVIALLGVLRAGMIAVPLPLLWRQRDMIEALGHIGAKAIVTSARIGACAHAEIAMQVAAELFPIRYVCAFDGDANDGLVPLDDIFAGAAGDFATPAGRPGNPAAHVAAVTFERGADGFIPVARSHRELIAGGLGVFLESGMRADTALLSTIPLGSFAGLALTLMPWLIGGGALHLHHGFDAETFAAQIGGLDGGAVVLPGPALTPLAEAGILAGAGTVMALWRSPERLASCTSWTGEAALIDVAAFGEVGVLAARRPANGMPAPLPLGAAANPRGIAGAALVGETRRSKSNTLALRGPMVPVNAFPPGAERGHAPRLLADTEGFVDTGFSCRREPGGETLTVTGAPSGAAGVGFYRFRQQELETLVSGIDPEATIVALPDAVLGQRLAASTRDGLFMQAELARHGVNPLVAGAFRRRGPDAA